MSADADGARTLADVASEHPEGYRELLADAEDLGLDVLAEPMRVALEDAGRGNG